MQEVKTLNATLQVRGTFVCADAEGKTLKEITLTGSVPLYDILAQQTTEEDHADHRSE